MEFTIVFGGSSYEHEISIVSAISLKKVLKKSQLQFIFLDQHRDFYLINDADMRSDFFASGKYKKSQKIEMVQGGFEYQALLKRKKIQVSTLVNLIHGRDGEDGKLASLFDFFGIDYIGPRIEASVLSYNKLLTKHLAFEVGVKTLPYQVIRSKTEMIDIAYPFIIKPLKLGSSIGVSIVKSEKELDYALDVAFEFDTQILIEPFIDGIKEYNLAGCYVGEMCYSIIEEPQKKEFLDFEKKYLDFARIQKTLQADLPQAQQEALKQSFEKIYQSYFGGSLIRCDFFIHDGEVLLNEINPVPGSMANYLFKDFESTLKLLAIHIGREKKIDINYEYINKVASAKGKAR